MNENEKRETLADIEAELRELSRSGELAIGASYCEPQPTVHGKPIGIYFSEIADRIEAAAKREAEHVTACHAIGNAAAMFEALNEIAHYCDDRNRMDDPYCADGHILSDIARAALSAPPRQCDVGTAEEQSVRMSEFCREQYKKSDGVALCSGCRFHDIEGLDCQFAWAQMPYDSERGDLCHED